MAWITYTDDLSVKLEPLTVNGKDGWQVFITDEEYDEDDASLIFQDYKGLVEFAQDLWKALNEEGLILDYMEEHGYGA